MNVRRGAIRRHRHFFASPLPPEGGLPRPACALGLHRTQGVLAAQTLKRMEDSVGRDGEATHWGKSDTPASAKSYYLRVLRPATEKVSLRNLREMHTMAVVLDHLALGRSKAAADVAAQRLKALELASTTGSWDKAQYLELVPQEGATLVNKEEEYLATKETELYQRLHGPHRGKGKPSEHGWQNYDDKKKGDGSSKGKHKNKDSKGRGKDGPKGKHQDDGAQPHQYR